MKRLVAIAAALVASASGQSAPDELLEPMNRFAAVYNEFVDGLHAGKFDARQAQRLSKLWRDVERSGNWPQVYREYRVKK